MYDDVLLPVDGSPGAEAAIEHAIHLAAQNDAVVHAVHVVEVVDREEVTDGDGDAEGLGDVEEFLAPVQEAAAAAGVEVVEAVLEGRPQDRLVEYVEDQEIDLVVMGTHGKKGLSRVLLGSTAEKVVRHSPVPVLTVSDRTDPA